MYICYWYSYLSGTWLTTVEYSGEAYADQQPSDSVWLIPGTYDEEATNDHS